MPSDALAAFRELLTASGRMGSPSAAGYTFSTSMGHGLLDVITHEGERPPVIQDGDIPDPAVSQRYAERLDLLIGIVSRQPSIWEDSRYLSQQALTRRLARAYRSATGTDAKPPEEKTPKTLLAILEEYASKQGAVPPHLTYLIDRLRERESPVVPSAQFSRHHIDSFLRRRYPMTFLRAGEAAGVHPAILAWLAWQEDISAAFSTTPLSIRERGEPAKWVEIGAVEIPPVFPSLFADIDSLIIRAHDQRMTRLAEHSLHGLILSYAKRRRTKPLAQRLHIQETNLPQIATFLARRFRSSETPYTEGEMLQGLKIFFGYSGYQQELVFLHDSAANLFISPNAFDPALDRVQTLDGKEINPISLASYITDGQRITKAREAETKGGLKTIPVEIEKSGGQNSARAIIVPRGFSDIMSEVGWMLFSSLNHIEPRRKSFPEAWSVLRRVREDPEGYTPSEPQLKRVAEFMHAHFDFGRTPSVNDIVQALKIWFNVEGVRDRFAIARAEGEEIFAIPAEGVLGMWHEGRPVTLLDRDEEYSGNFQRLKTAFEQKAYPGSNTPQGLWRQRGVLIRSRFKTVPFLVRADQTGATYRTIGAVVIPPNFSDISVDVAEALSILVRDADKLNVPATTAASARTILAGDAQKVLGDGVKPLARELSSKVRVLDAYVDEDSWLAAIGIFADVLRVRSLPLLNPTKREIIVPDGITDYLEDPDYSYTRPEKAFSAQRSRKVLKTIDVLTGRTPALPADVLAKIAAPELIREIHFLADSALRAMSHEFIADLLVELAGSHPKFNIEGDAVAGAAAHFLWALHRNRVSAGAKGAVAALATLGYPDIGLDNIGLLFPAKFPDPSQVRQTLSRAKTSTLASDVPAVAIERPSVPHLISQARLIAMLKAKAAKGNDVAKMILNGSALIPLEKPGHLSRLIGGANFRFGMTGPGELKAGLVHISSPFSRFAVSGVFRFHGTDAIFEVQRHFNPRETDEARVSQVFARLSVNARAATGILSDPVNTGVSLAGGGIVSAAGIAGAAGAAMPPTILSQSFFINPAMTLGSII